MNGCRMLQPTRKSRYGAPSYVPAVHAGQLGPVAVHSTQTSGARTDGAADCIRPGSNLDGHQVLVVGLRVPSDLDVRL